MTQEEFAKQMGRLTAVYGDKAYPVERTKVLWGQVGDTDAFSFERIVDRWIGEEKYAPMMDKFREFAEVARRKGPSEGSALKKDQADKPDCMYCCDSGRILATCKTTGNLWEFMCNYCEARSVHGIDRISRDGAGESFRRLPWTSANSSTHSLITKWTPPVYSGGQFSADPKTVDEAIKRPG